MEDKANKAAPKTKAAGSFQFPSAGFRVNKFPEDAAKGGAANMAGQVMSRGAVDGMGTEARRANRGRTAGGLDKRTSGHPPGFCWVPTP